MSGCRQTRRMQTCKCHSAEHWAHRKAFQLMKDVEFAGLGDQRRQGDRPPPVAPASHLSYGLQRIASTVCQRVRRSQEQWLQPSHAELGPRRPKTCGEVQDLHASNRQVTVLLLSLSRHALQVV